MMICKVEFKGSTDNFEFFDNVDLLSSRYRVADTEGLIGKRWAVIDDAKSLSVTFTFEEGFYKTGFLVDPLVSKLSKWQVEEPTQKIAGHLQNVCFNILNDDTSLAYGYLIEDLRETHHHGGPRDLSNINIRTSYLMALEFHDLTNTTIITTRNSRYFAIGDILELGSKVIKGRKEVSDYVKDHNRNLYVLTEAGADMTGETLGSTISRNLNFTDHELCGDGKQAFSLDENRHSKDLKDVLFLKPIEYIQE